MVDKRPIGYVPGKPYFLDKKVPVSKKYQNVKSNLDTGTTAKNVEFLSDQLIAKKKSECFKRIKGSTLVKVLLVHFHLIKEETKTESIYNLQPNNKENELVSESISNYGEGESIISDVNKKALSIVTVQTEQLNLNSDVKYLILDLRDPQEFDDYHIKEALLFPAQFLMRDKVLPEILRFKNKENKFIILYHWDEKNGTKWAKTFFEKGYENIFLLSEGMEKFAKNFYEYIEGKKLPELPKDEAPKEKVLLNQRNMGDLGFHQSIKFTADNFNKEGSVFQKSTISETKSSVSKVSKKPSIPGRK